jgi:NADPH-dependent 7-cyano-7-deazaguanine reductase QueF
MSHVLTVEDTSDVTITATGDIRHRCPHVDEVDRGRVTITWRVRGRTYELHSLAEYLKGFADAHLSHEQITDRIRHDLSVVREIELVSVDTTWFTADLTVSVTTQPVGGA